MQTRLRWTVIGLVLIALVGTVVAFRLRSDVGLTEVWRTDTSEVLHSGPGGAALDDIVLLPCSDPSGKRVDYVARRPSPLDGPVLPGQGVIHRLDETEAVVELRGERWHRFLVRAEALTPEEVEHDLDK